jgi:hypothetical protein
VATEPEFYDRLVECFPHIDAQRRIWKDFDVEKLISGYADDGFNGASNFINDFIIGEEAARSARTFVAKFRQKQATDPGGYPLNYLIRTLLLNQFDSNSPTPVGPKTKAHAVRTIESTEEQSETFEY